jgi:hypothetical protein
MWTEEDSEAQVDLLASLGGCFGACPMAPSIQCSRAAWVALERSLWRETCFLECTISRFV